MDSKSKKLLIIEDDAMLMRLLVKQFEKLNIEVLQANNGKSGLEIALKNQPDLILLDIIMPKMDGVTVTRGLRADKKCKKVPILFWTNLSAKEVKDSIYDNNSEYLSKAELSLKDLVDKVEQYLK